MIKLQITARKYEIDSNLKKYITKKLGKLDKYLPKKYPAKGLSVEVFRDPSGKEDNRYKVKAILEVAGPDLVAETATINPHSAIDIIEQKLKLQIKKYKDKHSVKRFRLKDAFTILRRK